MLELRPGCEHCNKPLPPESTEAMICSYECTFCHDCVSSVLGNVCPNCGGGFAPRPIRPKADLMRHPASTRSVYRPVDPQSHLVYAAAIRNIPPHER